MTCPNSIPIVWLMRVPARHASARLLYLLSNPSQPPARHAEHSAPSPNRIEVGEHTPSDTHGSTATPIPPD
jgi:hypothetical protein